MADPDQTKHWLQHYNAQAGVQALGLCAKKQGELERVLTACRALRPDRGAPDKPLRMMILGVPNVGKSTLMNAILKRHVAHVGDEPAITKIQMFHRLGPGMSLVDTPGMLWPGMEQATAYRLAALHSIGRGAYDDEEVALTLGLYLLRHYPELLAQRFGVLPRPCDEHMLLSLIATVRSFAKKPGGGPDLARASVALLNDFRTGVLGRITLETVDEATPRA
jgi:ribosome biogenesis GTPase A